jgi:branched-chain amino acid transport system substrate-binding protein
MKRRNLLIGIAATAAVGTVAVSTLQNYSSAPQSIKLGAILPLTGQNARYGTWIKEGLEMAKDEVNSSNGINGKKLEIVYEDDQANPAMAASAMQKLVNIDKVPVVYGSWASSSVLAQAPIAEKAKVVVMAEAISPKIRDAGDYIFRMQPDARYYIRQLVPFIYKDAKLKKVAILNVNNDFGTDQAKVFAEEFVKLGGVVVAQDKFEQNATDFKTELLKIKEKNPEAIFVPAYTEIAIVLKQARELGMKQQFIASVPFENPDIIKTAGNTAEGVIYPHHFDAGSTEKSVQTYQDKYKAKFGHVSEGLAALSYDGMKIIIETIKTCGEDSTCIKDKLYKVNNFDGVTGKTSFDDRGDVVKSILIKTVKDGRFVKIR